MGIFLFIRNFRRLRLSTLNKMINIKIGLNIAYVAKGKKKIFNTKS